MTTVIDIVNFIAANYQVIISGIIGILTAMIAVALVIPGDQPEKFLQSIVDFLKGISKK